MEPRDIIGVRRLGRAQKALLWAAALTFALYLIPFGNYALYPLMLFSTFAHEMGHGIAAILVGGRFESFQMWSDGSGVASYAARPGAFSRAIVSAGGLLGPAALGAIFFFFARYPRSSRSMLLVFAICCVLAMVLVVRNVFGLAFVAALTAICLFVAVKISAHAAQVFTAFLAIQLSLSVFSRSDYLFTEYANTAGGRLPSDTAQMASALFLPYWFWGAVVGALSLVIMFFGVRSFLRAARFE